MSASGSQLVDVTERALAPAERDQLAARLAAVRRESYQTLAKPALANLIVGVFLGTLTISLPNARPGPVVLLLFALMLLFSLWSVLPRYRAMSREAAALSDALQASRARVTRVQSTRVVQFEEANDEGACYAFAQGNGLSLFIVGQRVDTGVHFPNSDFSIVELLGARGRPVDSMIVTDGARLAPERTVPASVRRLVLIPEHLTMVDAPIDRVEDALDRVR